LWDVVLNGRWLFSDPDRNCLVDDSLRTMVETVARTHAAAFGPSWERHASSGTLKSESQVCLLGRRTNQNTTSHAKRTEPFKQSSDALMR
jgi:hypothetical protein